MKQILTISKREIGSFFNSMVAYILIIAFLGLTGFFTWIGGGSDVFFRRQADMGVFFQTALLTLLLFIPAITMKLLAEEKRSGTLELLLTKNVSNFQVVAGKFLAAFGLVFIALLFTGIYYFTISGLGNFDHGANLCGYFGLLLLSAAYISIGLFASSITKNQIVAFLIAIFIGICFLFLFGILSSSTSGFLSDLFNTLDLTNHFASISRGVIDSKDVIYFLSITAIGIFLSEYMISKRN